jgi:hypothetical protein
MKSILFIIVILALSLGGGVSAQQKKDLPKDKKKIELKPNSREYRPVVMDNSKRRAEIRRDKAMILRKKMELQRMKMMQMQNKRALKQEQLNKKRQIMQQRRALRR